MILFICILMVACKMENNIPVGTRVTKIETYGPIGTFPDDLKQIWFPQACMHCDTPLCVPACPTGASMMREDGLVYIDPEPCLGCDYCVVACPYGSRMIDPASNKAVKCNLCMQLIDDGKPPTCAKHCMCEARIFGDLDDPDNAITQYLNKPGNNERAFYAMENQGTNPTVVYLEPKVGMLVDASELVGMQKA
jgi:molybdopterin-containing oxidoreductase family iron-sulfur binding subunit